MREDLMNGNLALPGGSILLDRFPYEAELISSFWNSLWGAYLNKRNSAINSTYWADRFEETKTFNIVLMSLSKAGWIDSNVIPQHNWAEVSIRESKLLSLVSEQELLGIRTNFKLNKYKLSLSDSISSKVTKIGGKLKDTGLKREGFSAAGNTQFGFDKEIISKYKEGITDNVNKGMVNIRKRFPRLGMDSASYDNVSSELITFYSEDTDGIYTLGNSFNDSRGRAISQGLKYVFNPISNKDARALLVLTY